jgi:lipoate-protein ligase B
MVFQYHHGTWKTFLSRHCKNMSIPTTTAIRPTSHAPRKNEPLPPPQQQQQEVEVRPPPPPRPLVTIRSSFHLLPPVLSPNTDNSGATNVRSNATMHSSLQNSTIVVPLPTTATTTTINSSSLTPTTTTTTSSSSRMDYVRGWAWQTVLLQQRLLLNRPSTTTGSSPSSTNCTTTTTEPTNTDYGTPPNELPSQVPSPPREEGNDDDRMQGGDMILLLEHEPVYTLGRGADETYIKYLFDEEEEEEDQLPVPSPDPRDHADDDDDTTETAPQVPQWSRAECRHRLSRQNRERSTSSRLTMETKDYLQLLQQQQQQQQQCPEQNNETSSSSSSSCHQSDSDPPCCRDNNVVNIRPDHRMVNFICDQYVPKHPVVLPMVVHHPGSETVQSSVPVYRVERGGQITFHGPGQLMIYPMFDLSSNRHFPKDLRWFVRQMEQVMMDTVQEILDVYGNHTTATTTEDTNLFRVMIHRDVLHTGVWVEKHPIVTPTTTPSSTDHHHHHHHHSPAPPPPPPPPSAPRVEKYKIAAIGIHASRWITSHGVCLNINPNLSYFDRIVPCGIQDPDRYVTSLEQVLSTPHTTIITTHHTRNGAPEPPPPITIPNKLSMPLVANIVLQHMQRIFQIDLVHGERLV